MSSPVEQIKDRLSILDVVSGYIKVEKSGKNFKARCPFHNEKTASFYISPDRGTYYCFGCGAKGDVFSFIEAFEGLDFMGALKMLAERAGVVIDRQAIGRPDPHGKIYTALEEAKRFFVSALPGNSDARAYLEKRSLTPATLANFSIGWAPSGWRNLYDHLSAKGFSDSELIHAGLAKQKDEGISGGAPYDVFRERIMLPIFDASGRCVAFSGRILGTGDEKTPKYINSPETPVFKKSETLYGFDKAKGHIRKYDFSILVEGPIDLLMAHQSGFANTVAVMGTAFTRSHAERLKRISGNMVIALDADTAGVTSALKVAKIAIPLGMDVKVAALPEGKDPADVLVENTDVWREAIRNSQHVIDFLLQRIINEEDDARKLKQRITREVVPYVALIENKIDQSHFIGVVARKLNVSEEIVREEVANVVKDAPKEVHIETAQVVQPLGRYDQIVRILSGIMFWQKKIDAQSPIAQRILDGMRVSLGSEPHDLFRDDEKDVLAFETEVAYGASDHLDHHVEEMLRSLEEHALKDKLTATMDALARAEREGKHDEALRLLAECKELSQKLNTLKMNVESTK